MANTETTIDHLIFDFTNPELTEIFVFVRSNDGLFGIDGWHNKTFPASMPAVDIIQKTFATSDYLTWPINAPNLLETE